MPVACSALYRSSQLDVAFISGIVDLLDFRFDWQCHGSTEMSVSGLASAEDYVGMCGEAPTLT